MRFISILVLISIASTSYAQQEELKFRIRRLLSLPETGSSIPSSSSGGGTGGPPPSPSIAPFFTSTPPSLPFTEGDEAYIEITADDADALDTLTITAPVIPWWLSILDRGDRTALLSGVAPLNGFGNTSPSFSSIPPSSFTVASSGTYIRYNYSITDGDRADTMAISAPTLPSWLVWNYNGNVYRSGMLSGVTPPNDTFIPNTPPSVSSTPPSSFTAASSGTYIRYNYSITDGDRADTMAISAPTLPSWLMWNYNGNVYRSGMLSGVTPPNDTPESNLSPTFITSPVYIGSAGTTYTYNIGFSDSNRIDVVKLTAPERPTWATLIDNGNYQRNGQLTGTPPSSGNYPVELRLVDSVGATTTQSFLISIP